MVFVYNHVENEGKYNCRMALMDKKFYLILNVAVGGILGGQRGIDDTICPQQID